MNTSDFLADHRRFFADSYAQFCAFGGPCVHFHRECLRAGEREFLSDRHLEMLYATLTAWGMHRMGDNDRTKTKLVDWDAFGRRCWRIATPSQACGTCDCSISLKKTMPTP